MTIVGDDLKKASFSLSRQERWNGCTTGSAFNAYRWVRGKNTGKTRCSLHGQKCVEGSTVGDSLKLTSAVKREGNTDLGPRGGGEYLVCLSVRWLTAQGYSILLRKL